MKLIRISKLIDRHGRVNGKNQFKRPQLLNPRQNGQTGWYYRSIVDRSRLFHKNCLKFGRTFD